MRRGETRTEPKQNVDVAASEGRIGRTHVIRETLGRLDPALNVAAERFRKREIARRGECRVIGVSSSVEGLRQGLDALRNAHVTHAQLAQGRVEMPEDLIRQILRDVVRRRW